MKLTKLYKGILVCSALVMAGFAFTSCEDEPDKYEVASGTPTINYIRPADINAADSLLDAAYMGNQICIVGENLRSIKHLLFNDQEATLNSSFITDNTAIVEVPSKIPGVVLNKIFMVNNANDTVSYDFKVLVPGPTVSSMDNEWAKAGDEATIKGNYFVDDPNVPIALLINGVNVPIKSIDMNNIYFTVPEGLTEGPVEVKTVYGSAKGNFNYKDSRGMITNFDGEGNSGTKGIVPQGWNLKMTYSDEGGVDGYYAQVGDGELTMPADGNWIEGFKISWWCGNWSGDPMSITSGAGAPLRNIFPAGYFDKPENLVFKFEVCIPASNPWQAGALQVLFVNNESCANDQWQNNQYIHTSAGADKGKIDQIFNDYGKKISLDLCRGLWAPWTDNGGSYDTGGKWVTVSMPIADFVFNRDGTPGLVGITPESFDSFIMWPEAGGVVGTECKPIIRYDNIRIVPIK